MYGSIEAGYCLIAEYSYYIILGLYRDIINEHILSSVAVTQSHFHSNQTAIHISSTLHNPLKIIVLL